MDNDEFTKKEQAFLNAAFCQDYNLVKFYLENGIDVNTKNSNGENALTKVLILTPYGEEAREQQKEIIKLLLAYGVDPNATATSGPYINKSPMDLVKDIKTASILIKHGGKVKNDTLLSAVLHRDYDLVKFCIENGMDPNATATSGPYINKSPMDFVQDIKIASILIKHGGEFKNDSQVLLNAAYDQNYDLVKVCLEHDVDINTKNSRGENALTKVLICTLYSEEAREQQKEIIKLLLAYGVDPNAIATSGPYINKSPMDLVEQMYDTEYKFYYKTIIKIHQALLSDTTNIFSDERITIIETILKDKCLITFKDLGYNKQLFQKHYQAVYKIYRLLENEPTVNKETLEIVKQKLIQGSSKECNISDVLGLKCQAGLVILKSMDNANKDQIEQLPPIPDTLKEWLVELGGEC